MNFKIINSTDKKFLGMGVSYDLNSKIISLPSGAEMQIEKVITTSNSIILSNSNYILEITGE